MGLFKKKEDKIVDVDLHELEVESGNGWKTCPRGFRRWWLS